VLGAELNDPEDIAKIYQAVRKNSFYGLIQSDLLISGLEIAMWDCLGKARSEPVWRLLGYQKSHPKLPYASVLFGDTPAETGEKARKLKQQGFRAVKFGWGQFGTKSIAHDEAHIASARAELGEDRLLMIDAGTVFKENVAAAAARLPALYESNVYWYEEPFDSYAISAYKELANCTPKIALAGGEGAHNRFQAQQLIDDGKVSFIQVDAGYVGGIYSAYQVAQYAKMRGVKYVNHTFTSQSALASSLQPFAGIADSDITEYPMEPKPLCQEITKDRIELDENGMIRAPEKPGIGVEINQDAIKKYLVTAKIEVGNQLLYQTPIV
jgi:L-alanine-DL-glutamate epimerase-like enolase superfamily enzyme